MYKLIICLHLFSQDHESILKGIVHVEMFAWIMKFKSKIPERISRCLYQENKAYEHCTEEIRISSCQNSARATKNTRVIHDGFRDLEPKLCSRVSCNVKIGLKSVKLCFQRDGYKNSKTLIYSLWEDQWDCWICLNSATSTCTIKFLSFDLIVLFF